MIFGMIIVATMFAGVAVSRRVPPAVRLVNVPLARGTNVSEGTIRFNSERRRNGADHGCSGRLFRLALHPGGAIIVV